MGKISKFNPPKIGQELLTDPRVSLSAKGLYAFLQVFEEDCELDFAFMCKVYNIDSQEFDNALNELISHGYVSIESQYGALVYILNGK
jgi:hypothetical protein